MCFKTESIKCILQSLETLNTGKPYKKSYQDMVKSIQVLRYFAGWADKNMGQNIPVGKCHLYFQI